MNHMEDSAVITATSGTTWSSGAMSIPAGAIITDVGCVVTATLGLGSGVLGLKAGVTAGATNIAAAVTNSLSTAVLRMQRMAQLLELFTVPLLLEIPLLVVPSGFGSNI